VLYEKFVTGKDKRVYIDGDGILTVENRTRFQTCQLASTRAHLSEIIAALQESMDLLA